MNVGIVDAIIRLIVGVLVAHIWKFVHVSSTMKWIFIVIGAILILTAVTRTCGIYKIFNINTFRGR